MSESDEKMGFIGFGEAAYFMSKGLLNEGINDIFAYDILWSTDPKGERSQRTKQLALEIGVKPVNDLKDLISRVHLIVSAVTPSVALNVARKAVGYVDRSKIYADINSKSPRVAKEIWNVIRVSGAKFVDVAVMGAIAKFGHRIPCLISGNGSEEFAKLSKYGMNIRVIGQEPGQASAVKMLRSIYTKGLTAIVYEAFTAASEYDVIQLLFESLAETEDSMMFKEMINMRVCSTAIHAKRRADEMEMVCNTLRDVNVEPIMSSSARQVLGNIARLELKEHFRGIKPDSFIYVFKAIKERRKSNPF